MKNLILNTWIIIFIIVLVAGFSFYYALQTKEFLWVSRSGSLMTVLGILLTIKHKMFFDSIYIHHLISNPVHFQNIQNLSSPIQLQQIQISESIEQIKQTKNRLRDEYIGFALTILGTIIWGYGDLLGVFYL